MHPAIIAAACQASNCTSNWQYATESWSKGGAILGAVILAVIAAVVLGVARKVAS